MTAFPGSWSTSKPGLRCALRVTGPPSYPGDSLQHLPIECEGGLSRDRNSRPLGILSTSLPRFGSASPRTPPLHAGSWVDFLIHRRSPKPFRVTAIPARSPSPGAHPAARVTGIPIENVMMSESWTSTPYLGALSRLSAAVSGARVTAIPIPAIDSKTLFGPLLEAACSLGNWAQDDSRDCDSRSCHCGIYTILDRSDCVDFLGSLAFFYLRLERLWITVGAGCRLLSTNTSIKESTDRSLRFQRLSGRSRDRRSGCRDWSSRSRDRLSRWRDPFSGMWTGCPHVQPGPGRR